MLPVALEYPPGIEMVSVCTVPARGGRSCEHFGGYKTINRIPLPLCERYRQALYMNFDYHNFSASCVAIGTMLC